jgi:hypothetical protein
MSRWFEPNLLKKVSRLGDLAAHKSEQLRFGFANQPHFSYVIWVILRMEPMTTI